MWTVATVVLVLLSFAAHEAGHANAMRKHGIRIEEAGFGLPFGPSVRIQLRWLSYPIKVHLVPLGAYVKPYAEESIRLQSMPYSVQAECYGAGPINNFIYAVGLGMFYTVIRLVQAPAEMDYRLRALATMVAIVLVLWFARRPLCTYALPVLGLFFAYLVVKGLIPHSAHHTASQIHHTSSAASSSTESDSSIQGPVAIAKTLSSKSLYRTVSWSAALSVAIGATNLLPLSILDGGRLYDALLRLFSTRAARVFRITTGFMLAGLFGFAYIHDLVH